MNINNYITRTVRDKIEQPADTREIELCLVINTHVSNVENITKKIYDFFVLPFLKDYVLLTFCDNRENVSAKKFVEKFLENIFQSRSGAKYSSFGYSGVLKTERIKSKKALLEDDETNEICLEDLSVHERFIKEILKTHHERPYDTRAIFKEIVQAEYPCDMEAGLYDVSLCYDLCCVSDNFYQGECEFSINLHSLGSNVDIMAEKFKNILSEFASEFKGCRGHVCVLHSNSSYACDEQIYFDEYKEGIVVLDDQIIEADEWMTLNYIEGLEWAVVVPEYIASRIENMDELLKREETKCEYLSNRALLLNSTKGIRQHRRRDYKNIYPLFKECLRPGFSEWDLWDIRMGGEDIFPLENQYEINGTKVKFSRGNFDFLLLEYN